MIHPKRTRATYPAAARSVAPLWAGLAASAAAMAFVIGMLVERGITL